MMFRTIAVEHGLPMAYYHDRHTILRSPKEPTLEDELAGRTPMSQVQRLLSELGVESIPAHSPQAKGRVERLWRTLQDRLVKELRLAGVTTMDEANAFLPGFIERHNARFALAPADPEPAWVPLPPDTDLAYYFAAREARVVRPDHTLAYERAIYQLRPAAGEPSLVGKSVRVHTTPEGELFLYDGKRRLRHKLVDPVAPAPAAPKPDKPAPPAKKTNPQGEAHRRAWLFGNHHRGEAPPARRGPL
jgi:hypothetical protein